MDPDNKTMFGRESYKALGSSWEELDYDDEVPEDDLKHEDL